LLLDLLQLGQHLFQARRFVDLPAALRGQANAGTIGTATLVGVTIRRCRTPGRCDQLRHRQATCYDLLLQRRDVVSLEVCLLVGWDRILPELGGGYLWTKQAHGWAHVAVRQL